VFASFTEPQVFGDFAEGIVPLLIVGIVLVAVWKSGVWLLITRPADPLSREQRANGRRHERLRRQSIDLERSLREVKIYYRHPRQAEILAESVRRLEAGLDRLNAAMARERAVGYSLLLERWLDRTEELFRDAYRWETETAGADLWSLQGRIRDLLERVHDLRPEGRQLILRIDRDPRAGELPLATETRELVRKTLAVLEVLRADLLAARGELEAESGLEEQRVSDPEATLQFVVQQHRTRRLRTRWPDPTHLDSSLGSRTSEAPGSAFLRSGRR
jgi:hypothetical protein